MRKFSIFTVSFVLIFIAFAGQASAANGFPDVKPGDTFYKEMMYLNGEGVIQGYPDGNFGPTDLVNRASAAIMIAKALGLDTTQRETRFPDVPASSKASGAIEAAADRGIIKGYVDGSFDPGKAVTRGEMAIFIARAFKYEIEDVRTFPDVPLSKSSYSSIRKIMAAGVTEGYSSGKFNPDQTLTRNQFSAFLARAMSEDFRIKVNACGYDQASKTNPDLQTVNCLLTTAALTSDGLAIPPEIVKGVALEEKNDWKHFLSNGEPFISDDNGIGLMQITDTTGFEEDKLKYDLNYNINAGITKLKQNFGLPVLPSVGSKSPNALESWYFAVMAYNGAVAENSPFVKATGNPNPDAYQEKVYAHIAKHGLKSTKISDIDMTSSDFTYGPETNWNIKFNKTHYPLKGNVETTSSERFVAGDIVHSTVNGRLRTKPTTTGTDFTSIITTDVIHIVGGPLYDENKNSTNSFIWYPAMIEKNGKKVYGYIASSNLVKK